MIAACPTCSARYRIDASRLRPEGARLRCSRCETVFRVRAPAESASAAAPAAPQSELAAATPGRAEITEPAVPGPGGEATGTAPSAPGVAAAPSAPAEVGASPSAPAAPRDSSRLVLVATPEPDAGKAAVTAISSWGLETLLVHDGVEAILNIQRALPRVVVLDAALPKMFGFQVCELVKRNESLRSIHVVLVGAIHDRDRYRRPPGDLYGADVYIERHELPEGLLAILRHAGLPVAEAAGPAPPAAPIPSPAPAQAPTPERVAPAFEESSPESVVAVAPEPALAEPAPAPREPAPAPPAPAEPAPAPREPVPAPPAPAEPAPAPASADPALGDEVAKAERLARIIVSDIVLYNQEKFDAALRTGNVVEALASELEEGHALFAQRVDPRVGDAQDFLSRELLRLARSRGMK
jgi:predicted Zn finger-like uncharacterized protein